MYTKDWLKNLPAGTKLVLGEEEADIYIVTDKKYKLKHKVQRYLKMPLSNEIVRLYWDNQEGQCRIAYQTYDHDFPLSGRLKDVIYLEESVLEAV